MFANYKICVVSSSRADFGLLTPLLRALDASENFQLQFVATGSHLSHEHGFTIQEIETSGIKVDVQVDISVDSASAIGIGETLARAASSFSKIFGELRPNLILIWRPLRDAGCRISGDMLGHSNFSSSWRRSLKALLTTQFAMQ